MGLTVRLAKVDFNNVIFLDLFQHNHKDFFFSFYLFIYFETAHYKEFVVCTTKRIFVLTFFFYARLSLF